jgi:hypothetical protein
MSEKTAALSLLGIALVLSGLFALAARRFGWLAKRHENKMLELLFSAYRVTEIKWLGGGQQRYLRVIGWTLLLAGILFLLSLMGSA